MTVAMPRADLGLEVVTRRIEHDLLGQALQQRHVLRVHQRVPVIDRQRRAIRRQAEHLAPARVDLQHRGAGLPVPQPEVTALQREAQLLFATQQCLLGAASHADVAQDHDGAAAAHRER